jgi:hypothetical protein
LVDWHVELLDTLLYLLRSSGCKAISLVMFSLSEHPNEFLICDMGGVSSWV